MQRCKIIPSNLFEKINVDNESFKFDGYIYCENNQIVEKNYLNSIHKRLLYKELYSKNRKTL